MICREEKTVKENLHGGKGAIELYNILSEPELMGHAKMYAHGIMHPDTSIGWHIHEGTTEPIYIMKGEGVFTDSDKSRHVVHAGDICKIECGCGHALANESDEDLEFIALILNEGPKAE
ncbi:MAG: cupin domain-containing protein [Eggerthellaceae bacterium]|nr:cupin domain-containing protein [Eggerthellaceae bacterium]